MIFPPFRRPGLLSRGYVHKGLLTYTSLPLRNACGLTLLAAVYNINRRILQTVFSIFPPCLGPENQDVGSLCCLFGTQAGKQRNDDSHGHGSPGGSCQSKANHRKGAVL